MPYISIIDHDKDLLKVIQSLLYKNGFDVSTFFDWEVAYKAFKIFKPQLILLDVFLSPNMDGLDVCQKLRSSPYTKNIPVILCSAFPKIAESGIKDYGADDFIAKPFETSVLLKKLYSLLKRGNLSRNFLRHKSYKFGDLFKKTISPPLTDWSYQQI